MVPVWEILALVAMEASWNLRESGKSTLAEMHIPPTTEWNFEG
jgi:hypothetical protein